MGRREKPQLDGECVDGEAAMPAKTDNNVNDDAWQYLSKKEKRNRRKRAPKNGPSEEKTAKEKEEFEEDEEEEHDENVDDDEEEHEEKLARKKEHEVQMSKKKASEEQEAKKAADKEKDRKAHAEQDQAPIAVLVLTDVTNVCDMCRLLLASPMEISEQIGLYPGEHSGYSGYSAVAEHHRTRAALFTAIRAGCPLCFMIFHAISKANKKQTEGSVRTVHPQYAWHATSYLVPDSCLHPESNLLSMSCRLSTDFQEPKSLLSDGWMRLEIFYGSGHSKPYPTLTQYYYSPRPSLHESLDRFPGNISSTASVDVQGWLSECLNHHDCEKNREAGYLPTRLLKCSNGSVSLIESQIINAVDVQATRYAALSYCWGRTPKHLRLTTNNIEKLSQGIPLESLPATFVDAFQIANRLEIDHLWIDSLCIIQEGDAGQDWLRQVKQMHKVYANCVLNIAAAHATDADGGCFSERRRPTEYLQRPLAKPPPIEGTLPLGLTIEGAGSKFTFPKEATKPFHGFKLNSRGWVFQERLLAPRTVHYDKYDLYWECNEKVASGYIPMGFTLNNLLRYKTAILRPLFSFRMELEPKNEAYPSGEYMAHWASLVASYSKRQLTKPEDKLIAFSSVSQGICELWKDDYIAGYCEALLPQALVWHRTSNSFGPDYEASNKNGNATPFGIPSWSWASLNEQVTFNYHVPSLYKENPICAKVIATKVSLLDKSNKFGPMTSASITIQGPVFSVVVEKLVQIDYSGALLVPEHSRHFWRDPNTQGTIIANNPVLYISALFAEPKSPARLEAKYGGLYQFYFYPDKSLEYDHPASFKRLVFLVIATGYKRSCNGLVLMPLHKGEVYSRVGHFDMILDWGSLQSLMSDVKRVTIV